MFKTANTTSDPMSRISELRNVDNSSLTIPDDVINNAIKYAAIKKIADNQNSRRKTATNTYYEVTGKNMVLMHVRDHRYVVISRTINFNGKEIDLVKELCQFSFRMMKTSINRAHVGCSTPCYMQKKLNMSGTMYLTRIIISLLMYGDIRNLDSEYDVHHKGDCWDNRVGCIRYIQSSQHKHRNNHMTGHVVESLYRMIEQIRELDTKYTKLCGLVEVV